MSRPTSTPAGAHAAQRAWLQARRAELVAQVAQESASLNDPLGTVVPPAEGAGDREAGANEIRDVFASLSQAHRAELEAIDAALARIDDGDYGLCIDCGMAIGAQRLAAQPAALRCVACQTKAERGAAHASL